MRSNKSSFVMFPVRRPIRSNKFLSSTEITIGRDPSSNIAFDSPRDDIVSRRHAVIRVIRGDQTSFRLADLGSSNGTFLNGEPITEEKELLPEDTIGLGKNGLKFIFDVQTPASQYGVAHAGHRYH